MYNYTVTTDDFKRWVQDSGLGINIDMAVEEGRWWIVSTKGHGLVTTAKTIEGIKTLALFGIPVTRRDVEKCDNCYGYSFSCAGREYGPDGIGVIWYCYDCVEEDMARLQEAAARQMAVYGPDGDGYFDDEEPF